ncbi:UNKNOWN [Stylonychia lemnae]|uniref:Uncharacterized protein n=1 Tax=Stylonychia lemnae TaxID=5949 RepID=A0A078ALF0_STYLE|nr:UNKNOWN [Stylonychia lemnae]|eukprot:CDW82701.1 UNKNOWN [Stylonychia lemnae]
MFTQSQSQPILGHLRHPSLLINNNQGVDIREDSVNLQTTDKNQIKQLIQQQLGSNYFLIDLNQINNTDNNVQEHQEYNIFKKAQAVINQDIKRNKKFKYIDNYKEDLFVKTINNLVKELILAFNNKIQELELKINQLENQFQPSLAQQMQKQSQSLASFASTEQVRFSVEEEGSPQATLKKEIRQSPQFRIHKNLNQNMSINTLLSLSSLNEETPIDFQNQLQSRNFQTIFEYMPFQDNSPSSKMTVEEKEQYLIQRNREALKSYLQMVERQTVDIDESMDEKLIPNCHPLKQPVLYDISSDRVLTSSDQEQFNTKISLLTTWDNNIIKPQTQATQSQDMSQRNSQNYQQFLSFKSQQNTQDFYTKSRNEITLERRISDISNQGENQCLNSSVLDSSYAYSELSSLCQETTLMEISEQMHKVKHKQKLMN